MHVQRHAPPVEIRRPEAEATRDALNDLGAAERRGAGQGRRIARGYARGRVHG